MEHFVDFTKFIVLHLACIVKDNYNVAVIIVKKGHGGPGSNPRQSLMYFTSRKHSWHEGYYKGIVCTLLFSYQLCVNDQAD